MKKILAVLVVLAMALSVSVAFADTNAVELKASACNQTRFQFDIDGINVKNGDTIVILAQFPEFKSVDGVAGTLQKVTVRTANAGSPKFIDGKVIADDWAKNLGNGWYEITLTATADSDGITCAFFFYDEAGTELKPADGTVINFASVTVGETAYTFEDDAKIEAAIFQGRDLTMEAKAVSVTLPSAESTEDTTETEDATETEDTTVEETGVVSVAVAAVVAVIGGAVVLKKKEF